MCMHLDRVETQMTARPKRYQHSLVRARLMYGQITDGAAAERRACLIVEDPDRRLYCNYRLPRTASVDSVLAMCAGPLLVLPIAGLARVYAILADTDEAIATLREHSARAEDRAIYDSILEARDQAMATAASTSSVTGTSDAVTWMYLDRTLEVEPSLLDSIGAVLEQTMDSFVVTPSAFRCAEAGVDRSPLWARFEALDPDQS